MKGSGIGGQAVMEGVMMKNKDKYAVAVRKPDNEIIVDVKEYKSITDKYKFLGWPILRGVVAFIESMIIGVGTLTYSASFFEEEEGPKKEKTPEEEKKDKQKESLMMAGTVCLSIVLAVAIFMLLPYFLSRILSRVITSEALLALCEGVIRVALFVGYVAAISLMKDIKRVFMYHGAEHKSINCIEHGMELTVENVRKQSREHKRCGTSFLLIVMLISVVFFMFIRVDNAWLRILLRLLLIPIIAGISYEFIKLAGRTDNAFITALSKPGLALQKLTTAEPDDSMIECAIASVEAVFDWRAFLENFDSEEPKPDDEVQATAEPEEQLSEVDSDEEPEDEEPAADVTEEVISEEDITEEEAEEPVKVEEPAVKAEEPAKIAEKPLKAEEPAKAEEKPVKTEKKISQVDLTRPSLPDDEEDDEILKALDQYFILKQKKESEK